MEWYKQVQQTLNRYVQAQDRLLVAVSGGADSVCLLNLLVKDLGIDTNRLTVGHVDHQMRSNSSEDWAFVQNLCDKLGVKFLGRKGNALIMAAEQRLSQEQAARNLRYHLLKEMAEVSNCKWILTAHTLDDAAETVFMRMRSGALWYEWTGIPVKRAQIIRPFIDIFRDDIYKYIELRSLEFRYDESNKDPRYLRNKLRLELTQHPMFWSQERRKELAASGQSIYDTIQTLHRLTWIVPVCLDLHNHRQRIGLAIDKIFHYFTVLDFIPVEAAWGRLSGRTEGRLSSNLRRQISDCLRGRNTEAKLLLPEGIQLLRQGGKVWLSHSEPALVSQSVTTGEWELPEYGWTLRISEQALPEVDKGRTVEIDGDWLKYSLKLRNWQPGDRIKLLKRPVKKISDLLAEKKTDPFLRARTLVLTDDAGVFMISGGLTDERALPDKSCSKKIWIQWEEIKWK